MNTKLLLFAIYVISLTLFIQFFFPAKDSAPLIDTIVLSVEDDVIVVPNLPKVNLINNTQTGFVFDTCQALSITIDSAPLTDIRLARPSFCQDIVVPPKGEVPIIFDELAQVFAKTPGAYMISLTTPLGDRMVTFDLEMPGAFRSLLTTLFYNPIYNLFVFLLTFLPGHPLGWAIVIITLIIRVILLVPQHHMLESQKKLQVLQPKIRELQALYKNDQSKLGMEMLELYKKEGVSPMGSCLPLLIQMPILIGLYWVISGITEASNFYHLYPFFEGFNPKEIDAEFYGLDLLQVGGVAAIAFGIALAILQYIQARLSFAYNGPLPVPQNTKKEGETPEIALDPAVMQKMMLYVLPLTIGVSALFFPLGIGLYWFIGTLFVIGQQYYVHIQKPKKALKKKAKHMEENTEPTL